MTYAIDPNPLWRPDPATVGDTRMAHFMRDTNHACYADLWRWSVDRPEAFWSKIWDYCAVVGEKVKASCSTATKCLVPAGSPRRG